MRLAFPVARQLPEIESIVLSEVDIVRQVRSTKDTDQREIVEVNG